MAFTLKYKPVKLRSGEIIYRPLIPLTFEGAEKIDIFAVLDSGSDVSIIPRDMASVLGIKSAGENEIFGLGGISIKSGCGKARISFGKGHEVYSFDTKKFEFAQAPLLQSVSKQIQILSAQDTKNFGNQILGCAQYANYQKILAFTPP